MKSEGLTRTPPLARQLWLDRLQQSWLLRNVLLLLLWLLVFEIGWLVEYTHHASVWYPVAGLTFASLLLLGFSVLPALLTGCVLITFYTAGHYNIQLPAWQLFEAGLLFGLAHILPYGVGAILLRTLAKRGERDISRIIVSFLVIAAVSSFCATWLVIPHS